MVNFIDTEYGLEANITLDKWNSKFGFTHDINVNFCSIKHEVTTNELYTINSFIDNQELILSNILDYVMEIYPDIREETLEILKCDGWDDEYILETIPEKVRKESFYRLIKLHSITIFEEMYEGANILGLRFNCTWEEEHGFGLLIHKDKVLGWGDEDFAMYSAYSKSALEQLKNNTEYGLKTKIILEKWDEKFGFKHNIRLFFDRSKHEISQINRDKTINMFINNQEEILSTILDFAVKIYPSVRAKELEFLNQELLLPENILKLKEIELSDLNNINNDILKRISKIFPKKIEKETFYRLIELELVVIHDESHEGIHILGLCFNCPWNFGRGFGLLIHKNKILGWGDYNFARDHMNVRVIYEQLQNR